MPNLEESAAAAVNPWPDNLALFFQELYTAVVRLRAGRQEVNNADVFRNQVLHAIKTAEQNARTRGYTDEDVRLGDVRHGGVPGRIHSQSAQAGIQRLGAQTAAGGAIRPPCGGRNVLREPAGDSGRRDAPEVADLLEVYYLCLLLGYLGRYSISSKGDLRALMGQTDDKIKRIRKSRVDLSPNWALPHASRRDRCGRTRGCAAC